MDASSGIELVTSRMAAKRGARIVLVARSEEALGPVRAKTEAPLHENEERFRHYFELGLIGMAITSPTKGCLEVNDRIFEILGYERSEGLASRWPSI